jgi:SAM-dependent methyltransferase
MKKSTRVVGMMNPIRSTAATKSNTGINFLATAVNRFIMRIIKVNTGQVLIYSCSACMPNFFRFDRSAGILNVKIHLFDLEKEDFKEKRSDFVFTQMTLHHVADVENILGKFHKLLLPGTYLAIADLYPEDGSFHGAGFEGHKGFNPEELAHTLSNIGFHGIRHRQCFVIDRKNENDSRSGQYSVFLLAASHK